MNSEDCSITENSALHVERGQQSNATSPHFATHREGCLQVPVPCAVLNVVIITVLIISLIALSVGQYNCPGQHTSSRPSESQLSLCSGGWIRHQRKCYFASTTTGNWTLAQNTCSKHGATLTLVDSEEEMMFLRQYVRRAEHWIRVKNETGHSQKRLNGKELNNWSNITESENCSFLGSIDVGRTECDKNLHWICSKPSH